MPPPNAPALYPRLCSSMDVPKNDRATNTNPRSNLAMAEAQREHGLRMKSSRTAPMSFRELLALIDVAILPLPFCESQLIEFTTLSR